MYATCLFCNGDLGRNETIEHFPVGRRLAFDAAKGGCGWCAASASDGISRRSRSGGRRSRSASARSAARASASPPTRSVSHALTEGLELVRIGEPLRPEIAAWRYGDQFGRRRRRHYA